MGTNITINSGRMSINLKPLEQRKMNASDIIRRLQGKLNNVQGIQLFMQPVQNITIDDRVSRTQYQYTLEDPDPNELNDWTNRFVANLKKLPELEDVATDQQPGGLAVSLVIDRSTASGLGIAPTTIDNTLYDAFGQRQINTMYTQLNQYHVILEAQPQFQLDPDKLNKLYIQANSAANTTGAAASSSGNGSTSAGSNALTGSALLYTIGEHPRLRPRMRSLRARRATPVKERHPPELQVPQSSNAVPLGAFSHFETKTEQLSINHQGQFPAITVSFNLAPNAALGGAISAITKVQKDMHMPASLQADFQGTAASFRNSLSNMPLLILAALVTVYIVLGVLYESFIHPITILSTLPSAGVGAFLALILFRAGSQRRCHHRSRAPHRHREKKRHHDGRLRAGRRAQPWEKFHRRHLRGVLTAFSAHHDDHDGGAARRSAARHSAAVLALNCAGRLVSPWLADSW